MDFPQMTKDQAIALAGFILAMRPDWNADDLMQSLSVLSRKGPAPDMAHVALRAAAASENRIPSAITRTGPHWTLPWKEPDRTPPRELWCIEHDRIESACKGLHVRTEPPDGWRDRKESS